MLLPYFSSWRTLFFFRLEIFVWNYKLSLKLSWENIAQETTVRQITLLKLYSFKKYTLGSLLLNWCLQSATRFDWLSKVRETSNNSKEIFTAKCPRGEKYGEMSHGKKVVRWNVPRRNFLTAKCPYGEMSHGEMSHGEKSHGERSWNFCTTVCKSYLVCHKNKVFC